MVNRSNLLLRDGIYYARIYFPADLISHFGSEDKKISLRTKDKATAKVSLNIELAKWDAAFKAIRERRDLTAADKEEATWAHHNAILDDDERRRRSMPTQAAIDAEYDAVTDKLITGEIRSGDMIGMINGQTGLALLETQRERDADYRQRKLKAMRRQLSSGETGLIDHAAVDYIRGNNLLTLEGTDDYLDLCRRLMRAEIAGLEITLERDIGNYSALAVDPIVKPSAGRKRNRAAAGESVLEIFKIYERENPNKIAAATMKQARRDVGTFADSVGPNFSAKDIDKIAVREWKALLHDYPVKATETKDFEGMSIAQIVAHNFNVGKPVIKSNTINRYLSGLAAFCNWLVSNGYIDTNPTRDMFLAKDTTKKTYPFSSDQLTAIFSSSFFTGCESDRTPRYLQKPGSFLIRDHRYWVPLIMLYSAARPGEIGQLSIHNVRQEHGQWIMHITDESDDDDDGKTVKNLGSMRIVPVHDALVRLGFIKYHARMKAVGARLFPNAVRNSEGQMMAADSKTFSTYLTRIGVKKGRGLSLYSFRHGAVDALRRAGHLDENFGYILGHSGGDAKGRMTGRYGIIPQGLLEQRVTLINSIAYPGLDLNHLY